MSLSNNILIHPLEQQAREDLNLMVATARIIRDVSLLGMPPHEVDHLVGVANFLLELARLGDSVISRAGNERYGMGT